LENSFGQMEKNMWDNGLMVNNMDRVFIVHKVKLKRKENG